jgi:putative phosphoesterase
MLTFGVISDTHGKLHPNVFSEFEGVKCIFHCGDIGKPEILSDLAVIAPVHAVPGNMDSSDLYPMLRMRNVVEVDGLIFAITHGHLYPYPPENSIARIIADCGSPSPHVVMFGHTHQFTFKHHGDVVVLNPGSASRPPNGERPSAAVLIRDKKSESWDVRKVSF